MAIDHAEATEEVVGVEVSRTGRAECVRVLLIYSVIVQIGIAKHVRVKATMLGTRHVRITVD